ncbi:hypothetical protein D3C72_2446970 [compost metagenome]
MKDAQQKREPCPSTFLLSGNRLASVSIDASQQGAARQLGAPILWQDEDIKSAPLTSLSKARRSHTRRAIFFEAARDASK